MRILLVGDDARAHFLAEQLSRGSEVQVVMQRKNSGIVKAAQKSYVCEFSNIEAIGSWALKEEIDLGVIIDEYALVAGVGDALSESGIRLASPHMAAASIGNNRIYAKNIVRQIGIPQPQFFVCKTAKEAVRAAESFGQFLVKSAVRTDWKGTRFIEFSSKTKTELVKFCTMLIKKHGAVIIERKIDGEEFVVQSFSDGKSISLMPPVQNSKHSEEQSSGKITEGMGSYSTGRLLPFMRESDYNYAKSILQKIIDALGQRGSPFVGFLHGLFMATKTGVVLLDIRSTIGNPEGINNLSVLNGSLAEILLSMAEGSLKQAAFFDRATLSKYVVASGYPDKITKKSEINVDERKIWQVGAKHYINSVITKGGKRYADEHRTVLICSNSETLERAYATVENGCEFIGGEVFHREDICSPDYIRQKISHMESLRSYSAR